MIATALAFTPIPVAILTAAGSGTALQQPVNVQGGLVSGVAGKHAGITAFKGVRLPRRRR